LLTLFILRICDLYNMNFDLRMMELVGQILPIRESPVHNAMLYGCDNKWKDLKGTFFVFFPSFVSNSWTKLKQDFLLKKGNNYCGFPKSNHFWKIYFPVNWDFQAFSAALIWETAVAWREFPPVSPLMFSPITQCSNRTHAEWNSPSIYYCLHFPRQIPQYRGKHST